jgi:hypothetical protein
LNDLQQEEKKTSRSSSEDRSAPEAIPGTNLPEWLSGLDKETPAGKPGSDLPSWLADEMQADGSLAEPTKPTDWKPIEEKESAGRGESWARQAEPAPEPRQPEQQQPASMPIEEGTPAMEIEKPVPPAPRPRSPEAVSASKEASLAGPRAEMGRGNVAGALAEYGRMIRKGKFLEEIIYDLREAIYRYPVEVPVWQALGDAYMRANRLQEALDAYTKAEELLR